MLIHPPKVVGPDLDDLDDRDTAFKVIDFGLSQKITPGQDLTDFVGSPGYIAPEFYLGIPHGESTETISCTGWQTVQVPPTDQVYRQPIIRIQGIKSFADESSLSRKACRHVVRWCHRIQSARRIHAVHSRRPELTGTLL